MSRRTIRPLRLSLLVLCLAACDTATPLVTETDTHDDGHGAATPAPTRPDAALSRRAPPRESEASANYERWPTPKQHAWVVNSFGFLYPSNEGHVDALDLDRHVSLENSPGADWCTHSDYTGPNGDAGIDYQFLRVIERFESLAQDNIADVIVDRAVRDGSMTLLVTLTPLNEPNNERYQVGLYSGADRPLTGSDGEVQAYSSFALHEFTGYHNDLGDATMHDGRLQSAATDILLDFTIMIVQAELRLARAQLRLDLQDDGSLVGLLAGYWSMEDLRTILAATPAHLQALGYTLEEFNDALSAAADFDPDDGGSCQALSAALRFTAVPAFITGTATGAP